MFPIVTTVLLGGYAIAVLVNLIRDERDRRLKEQRLKDAIACQTYMRLYALMLLSKRLSELQEEQPPSPGEGLVEYLERCLDK